MTIHNKTDWGEAGRLIRPGDGIAVPVGSGHSLEVTLRGTDVGGAMGVFVFTHGPIREHEAHSHSHFMKILYVIEGNYEFRVGGASFGTGPGGMVVVPKGSSHSFVTEHGGQVLFACSPAGNEEMFLELGRLGPQPAPAELGEVFGRYGMLFAPPS
jgi:quercetin dioxygenase-like cupin family protein